MSVGGGGDLRAIANIGSMMGHKGAQASLNQMLDLDKEQARLADKAADRAATLAAAGLKDGKLGLEDVKFYDPPSIDPKTGQTVPGKHRDDLDNTFLTSYLPSAAARLGKRPNQLEPVELAKFKLGFNLNRASQNYGLQTGASSFDFDQPIDMSTVKYVKNVPESLGRLVSRSRGEASWGEGFFDKGMLVISDGRKDAKGNLVNQQEIPIRYLEESNALRDPALSAFVKELMGSKQTK